MAPETVVLFCFLGGFHVVEFVEVLSVLPCARIIAGVGVISFSATFNFHCFNLKKEIKN